MSVAATPRDLPCLHVDIVEDGTVVRLCTCPACSEDHSQRSDALPAPRALVAALRHPDAACCQDTHGAQRCILGQNLLQLLGVIQPGLQDPIPALAGVLQEVDAHPTFAVLVLGDDLHAKLPKLGELAEPHTWTARHSFFGCPHQKIPLALHVVIDLHLIFQLVVVQGCNCAIQPPERKPIFGGEQLLLIRHRECPEECWEVAEWVFHLFVTEQDSERGEEGCQGIHDKGENPSSPPERNPQRKRQNCAG